MNIKNALCLLALLALEASAQPALDWKVGTAKVDITPSESVQMAGFSFRKGRPSEGIRDQIYIRALAFTDVRGQNAAIITFDLASIRKEMAETIADRCREQYGISRDRLLMNVSHTHSGPAVGGPPRFGPQADQKPKQAGAPGSGSPAEPPGPPTGERGEKRPEWKGLTTEFIVDKAVEALGMAMHDLKPVQLEFGVGMAGVAVNRRRTPTFGAQPDGSPGGPVDSDVPVIAARDAENKLIAVVFGYACHDTSLMDYLISNDFAGYALHDLDNAHPGVMAFFIQGCGGDSNAFPRASESLARDHGYVLAAAVEDVLSSKKMTRLSGPIVSAFDYVEVPYHYRYTRADLEQQAADKDPQVQRRAQMMLRRLGDANQTKAGYPYPVQVWSFGNKLTLIALGGEVVSEYALRIKKEHGFDRTWVAAYSNEIMGYIPTRRVLAEGGYGMDGGQGQVYSAAIEETIIAKVNELTQRVSQLDPSMAKDAQAAKK